MMNRLRRDCMNSKQQRTVKGKGQQAPLKSGWTALSWDDLSEWAGSRSVDRGRAYQKQGRVHAPTAFDAGFR